MATLPHVAAALRRADVVSTPHGLDALIHALKQELKDVLTERFNMRVQTLPQELQDSILECVITEKPSEDGVIYIDETYKPPLALQLNRKMRAAFALEYYGGDTIFQYMSPEAPHSPPLPTGVETRLHYPHLSDFAVKPLRNWLSNLEHQYRTLISTIRLDWKYPSKRDEILRGSLGSHCYTALVETWIADSRERQNGITLINKRVLVFRLRSDGGDRWYRADSDLVYHLNHDEIMEGLL
ncbi:uncharacterized protein RCC_06806 [Ramularia collo-cygni]|uniref:Uncharacterized protein n=1 Tax=Ramularia collo-cygni TaxID=112498 RepID=A0A2D3V2L0_9PEZI|nr:uncharacterized protein RCC_06806 [Ramularia collo-cygni]CZT20945.1 uncharacterized protein RCC_06806 [Ramularia collo-cygni]